MYQKNNKITPSAEEIPELGTVRHWSPGNNTHTCFAADHRGSADRTWEIPMTICAWDIHKDHYSW